MNVTVREYMSADAMAAMKIWNEVVEEGDAFPQLKGLTEDNADAFFKHQSYTGIAVDADGRIVGLSILHPIDTPTAKARGILEKSDCLRNPYSQRACQQPSTQSLKAEVLFTFLCNVARSVGVCVNERVFFGTVQSPFDAFA